MLWLFAVCVITLTAIHIITQPGRADLATSVTKICFSIIGQIERVEHVQVMSFEECQESVCSFVFHSLVPFVVWLTDQRVSEGSVDNENRESDTEDCHGVYLVCRFLFFVHCH